METEFEKLVDRLVGVLIPLKEIIEVGVHGADDLDEMMSLGADLRTTAEGLIDELRAMRPGETVPDRWRQSSIAPWRGSESG